eukprot:TRINITY_DN3015_c0_g1_i1.p1 TRINITY_DN3015_c0_g1~~TRINITY_DN3015_c0_g1_i1.p1  ORF type:complete len:944 (+),score=233.18 TRINITY_DN3015_c0_g1_i1:287-2833(+)
MPVMRLPNGSLVYDGMLFDPHHNKPTGDWDHLLQPNTAEFWVYVALVATCVTGAALAAGLTMGLVSVDALKLHVILEAELSDDEDEGCLERDRTRLKELSRRHHHLQRTPSTDTSRSAELETIESELQVLETRLAEHEQTNMMREEKALAKTILPVVEKHHLLLVTLLLCNAIANEAMPIFLDQLVPSWLAVLLSVSFVLVFGEIFPSAIFTGKHQLKIAAFFTPLVKATMLITAPISYPIAHLLDYAFGVEEHDAYSKDELKAFIRMHGHREPHQAVVIVRPHPEWHELEPPEHPPKEEYDEAYTDARMLGLMTPEGQPNAHDSRFCNTTNTEFKRWLEQLLLPSGFYPTHEWDILMHPMSSERRDMNKTRCQVGFSSLDDARQVCRIINSSIAEVGGGAWIHGWVRVEAQLAENNHAVRMQKLANDECAILCGVIGLGEKPVKEAAHLLSEKLKTDAKAWAIYMLPHNTILDNAKLVEVMRQGYSRIPIYQVEEYDVKLKRAGKGDAWGFQLAKPGQDDEDSMWGRWNSVGFVSGGSPAARAGISTDLFICGVDGVRVKTLQEFEEAVAKSALEMNITVYQDSAQDRARVCGILLAKRLLVVSPADHRMVGDVTERFPLAVHPDDTLLETLSKFRQGDSHLAIVTNSPDGLEACWKEYRTARLPTAADLMRASGKKRDGSNDKKKKDPLKWAQPISSGEVDVHGIITFEDVIEEFMGDIQDETDSRDHKRTRLDVLRYERQQMVNSVLSSGMVGKSGSPSLFNTYHNASFVQTPGRHAMSSVGMAGLMTTRKTGRSNTSANAVTPTFRSVSRDQRCSSLTLHEGTPLMAQTSSVKSMHKSQSYYSG